MPNESILAIPDNIEDPNVLRRTITNIVQEIDIILGLRQREETSNLPNSFTKTEQLNTGLESTNNNLARLQATLTELTKKLNSIEELSQGNRSFIENLTGLITFQIIFGPSAAIDKSYNVENPVQITTGTYTFNLIQNEYFGVNVLDNSIFTWHANIPSNSGIKQVVVNKASSTKLQVRVYRSNSGSKSLYSLSSSDRVQVMGTFIKPNAKSAGDYNV